jgi:hypothetical protein
MYLCSPWRSQQGSAEIAPARVNTLFLAKYLKMNGYLKSHVDDARKSVGEDGASLATHMSHCFYKDLLKSSDNPHNHQNGKEDDAQNK